MWANVAELIRARELLYRWTRREFGVRYSQSLLGAAWSLLQPLALMVVFSLVFSVFIRIPTGDIPYPVFAYSALLPWTLFSTALSYAIPSLVNNFSLVSRIYFPREILPIATVIVSFIDFLIASLAFVALLWFYHIPLTPTMLFVPLIVGVQLILMVAVTLMGSAFNVFYRDVRFVIPLLLQIWMYLSPIIYSIEVIPERFRAIYLLNPLATIIESYRRAIFFNLAPDWPYFTLAAVISVLLLLWGYRYFKRAEVRFADLI